MLASTRRCLQSNVLRNNAIRWASNQSNSAGPSTRPKAHGQAEAIEQPNDQVKARLKGRPAGKSKGQPEPQTKGSETFGALQELMDEVSSNYEQATKHNSKVNESVEETIIPFKVHAHLKPVDLRKDFRQKLPRPKRPREGPGRKDAWQSDIFLRLKIDPRRECENASLMSDYVSDMGKILPRATTGLSHRSQRLLGKAIKRSKMMGIIPTLSRRNRFWQY